MLVISRGPGEGLTIGDDVRVVVRSIPSRGRVKLGVEAPPAVRILRDELEGAVAPVGQPASGGEFSVVVVEDDPVHARIIKRGLRAAGATEIRVEPTGGDALRGLVGDGTQPPPPDLVMLDLLLPDISGLEVLQALRARDRLRRTPVVVLSSSDSQASVARCLDAGANAFLVKEVRSSRFREEVQQAAEFWRRARRVA